jgi:hypothetical protein
MLQLLHLDLKSFLLLNSFYSIFLSFFVILIRYYTPPTLFYVKIFTRHFCSEIQQHYINITETSGDATVATGPFFTVFILQRITEIGPETFASDCSE